MPTEPAAPPPARRGTTQLCHGLVGAMFLSLLLFPAVILAQSNSSPGSNPEVGEGRGDRGNAAQQPSGPGELFQRLRELPPAQQRQMMADDPQFQHLPPGRQESIRQRLRDWNAMTPQEKERVREREEILESLSPAQRQEARNIFPQWRDLTPARRQAVMVAFRHLRNLPPHQRRSFLDSPEVREQFSPHERDILEGLSKLLPNSRAAAPHDADQ